jgi:IS30 family transposase
VKLLYLPGRHTAEAVRDALVAAFATIPAQLRRLLSWDQGQEMAHHKDINAALGPPVYFCAKASPWQTRVQGARQRAATPVLPEGHQPQ